VNELHRLAVLGRLVFDAASCSVALVEPDGLHYVAASGTGADGVRGMRLELGRGIAGYAVASGQAFEVDHVGADPRFARDVAERIGYVPTALLAAPMVGPAGDVVGVVSVLDRDRDRHGGAVAVELVAALADVAAVLVAPRPAAAGVLDLVADRVDRLELPAGEARLARRVGEVLGELLDGPAATP
jgi:signal transduction protein with GAF and PtsI domain